MRGGRRMPDHSLDQTRCLPGCYEHYLAKARAQSAEPDPRVFVGDCGPEGRRSSFIDLARLEADLPVALPKWMLGGHTWPEAKQWREYSDPEVWAYRLLCDDRLEPVRGDEVHLDPVPTAAPVRRVAGRRFNL